MPTDSSPVTRVARAGWFGWNRARLSIVLQ